VRFFGVIWIRNSDPRSLGSWCIKGTHESVTRVDSSVPLMHHDPSAFNLEITDPDQSHPTPTTKGGREETPWERGCKSPQWNALKDFMLPCVCLLDHRIYQNVVRTSVKHLAIASCVFLTTFWRHLWSIGEQPVKMESICWNDMEPNILKISLGTNFGSKVIFDK